MNNSDFRTIPNQEYELMKSRLEGLQRVGNGENVMYFHSTSHYVVPQYYYSWVYGATDIQKELIAQIESQEKEIQRLNARKWYQFWK